MSKKTSNDPRRAGRFVSKEGEFILQRAKGKKGKKPPPGVQRMGRL